MNPSAKRIVIAGGGFGGVYTALHLEKKLAHDPDVEVTLISEDNFLLFTPLLHEVAASSLDPADIVNPLRPMFRKVQFLEAEVRQIDVTARKITVAHGIKRETRDLEFDYLVIATGSEDNFFGNAQIERHVVTMKTVVDAMLLRNRMIALLENAVLEEDLERRRAMMTFVVAGGGFAGVEVVGALNDFLRSAVCWYPTLDHKALRLVLVHPKEVILPELGESLGHYAQKKLPERGVEILTNTKVTDFNGKLVTLDKGDPISAFTLVWTAGVTPGKLIEDLPGEKDNKRLKVNEFLEVPGMPGIWALGDNAAAIEARTGKPYPATAQHAVRQAKTVGQNIVAALRGQTPKAFRFHTIGQLAAIGHRTGVAQIYGMRFSGFIAWALWRSVYLMKLPRLQKKIRVAVHWTVDLFFPQDITQLMTIRSLDKICRMIDAAKHRDDSPPASPAPANPPAAAPH